MNDMPSKIPKRPIEDFKYKPLEGTRDGSHLENLKVLWKNIENNIAIFCARFNKFFHSNENHELNWLWSDHNVNNIDQNHGNFDNNIDSKSLINKGNNFDLENQLVNINIDQENNSTNQEENISNENFDKSKNNILVKEQNINTSNNEPTPKDLSNDQKPVIQDSNKKDIQSPEEKQQNINDDKQEILNNSYAQSKEKFDLNKKNDILEKTNQWSKRVDGYVDCIPKTRTINSLKRTKDMLQRKKQGRNISESFKNSQKNMNTSIVNTSNQKDLTVYRNPVTKNSLDFENKKITFNASKMTDFENQTMDLETSHTHSFTLEIGDKVLNFKLTGYSDQEISKMIEIYNTLDPKEKLELEVALFESAEHKMLPFDELSSKLMEELSKEKKINLEIENTSKKDEELNVFNVFNKIFNNLNSSTKNIVLDFFMDLIKSGVNKSLTYKSDFSKNEINLFSKAIEMEKPQWMRSEVEALYNIVSEDSNLLKTLKKYGLYNTDHTRLLEYFEKIKNKNISDYAFIKYTQEIMALIKDGYELSGNEIPIEVKHLFKQIDVKITKSREEEPILATPLNADEKLNALRRRVRALLISSLENKDLKASLGRFWGDVSKDNVLLRQLYEALVMNDLPRDEFFEKIKQAEGLIRKKIDPSTVYTSWFIPILNEMKKAIHEEEVKKSLDSKIEETQEAKVGEMKVDEEVIISHEGKLKDLKDFKEHLKTLSEKVYKNEEIKSYYDFDKLEIYFNNLKIETLSEYGLINYTIKILDLIESYKKNGLVNTTEIEGLLKSIDEKITYLENTVVVIKDPSSKEGKLKALRESASKLLLWAKENEELKSSLGRFWGNLSKDNQLLNALFDALVMNDLPEEEFLKTIQEAVSQEEPLGLITKGLRQSNLEYPEVLTKILKEMENLKG